jgi:hypothetical protein
MNYTEKIITEIELHSVEGIRECFENGVNPNGIFRGEILLYELTSEYTRSSGFKECVKLFIEFGLFFEDEALLAVLSDDAITLQRLVSNDYGILSKKYTLRCAYTPLYQVTLLHICAEFNLLSCAEVLVNCGADINANAGVDEYGFGGQTPVFHTVNQNGNNSKEMLEFLLSRSVDLQITVKGLIWGKGYEWETFIPAVNPISYAMMGILPQMHRDERTISKTIAVLLKRGYGIDYFPPNVPCAYLYKSTG